MDNTPLVGIIMGSDSDLEIMQPAADMLRHFNIPHELTIVSAHRTPDRMRQYATEAKSKVAETLNEFRGAYLYNLLDENVRRFHSHDFNDL